MSVYNLEPQQFDKPMIFDGSIAFSGGMFSNNDPENLEQFQFSEAQNCDIDLYGRLQTRIGTAQIGSRPNTTRVQGLTYYDIPSAEYLLQVSGMNLYKSTGGAWTLTAGYTAASDVLKIEFAQLIDKVAWVDGNGVAYRWDGTTVQASTAWGVATQPPTASKFIVEHKSRLAYAGASTQPQTVSFSDIIDYNTPAGNEVYVGKGDGDNITGLFSWLQNNLLVFKEKSIYAIDTTAGVGSTATTQKVHGSIGCVSHRTIKQIGSSEINNDVFFLAKDGVRSVQTTVQDGQIGSNSNAISYPINDWISRINWDFGDTCNAIYWNNRYMLAVPLDSAETPNYVLVYHTINKSWSGYWTGWVPTIFCISSFSDDNRLNFGQSNGKVLQWKDYVPATAEVDTDYFDDGVAIVTNLLSRGFSFSEIFNQKIGNFVECKFNNSRANVDITAYLDSAGGTSIATGVSSANSLGWTFPITFPWTLPANGTKRDKEDLLQFGDFRYIQIAVSATSGKVSLRSINIGGFLYLIQTS